MQTKNLGEIKEGKKQIVNFVVPYKIEVIKIPLKGWKITRSCGCISTNWLEKENMLVIKYRPKKVPKRIIENGKNFYYASKIITLYYLKNKKQEEMKFLITAKVTK
jgi:hypothetical protein